MQPSTVFVIFFNSMKKLVDMQKWFLLTNLRRRRIVSDTQVTVKVHRPLYFMIQYEFMLLYQDSYGGDSYYHRYCCNGSRDSVQSKK